jgi:hypothetical protein
VVDSDLFRLSKELTTPVLSVVLRVVLINPGPTESGNVWNATSIITMRRRLMIKKLPRAGVRVTRGL